MAHVLLVNDVSYLVIDLFMYNDTFCRYICARATCFAVGRDTVNGLAWLCIMCIVIFINIPKIRVTVSGTILAWPFSSRTSGIWSSVCLLDGRSLLQLLMTYFSFRVLQRHDVTLCFLIFRYYNYYSKINVTVRYVRLF